MAEERERREEEEGGGKGGREEDDVTLWRDTERLDTSAITPMHTYTRNEIAYTCIHGNICMHSTLAKSVRILRIYHVYTCLSSTFASGSGFGD